MGPSSWDYMIIGQGIGGSLLGEILHRAGRRVLFVDQGLGQGSSYGSAGMVQPFTGKRWAMHPDYPTFLDFAHRCYGQWEKKWGLNFWEKTIVRVAESMAETGPFQDRAKAHPLYFRCTGMPDQAISGFSAAFSSYYLTPAWKLDMARMLDTYRAMLLEEGRLIMETFRHERISFNSRFLSYGPHCAKRLIFAEGAFAMTNPWFSHYPFACHRGQALRISAPQIPSGQVYRFPGFMVVPMGGGECWVGASHERPGAKDLLDEDYIPGLEARLREILSGPFEVLGTWVGNRPSTRHRQPFWERHPQEHRICIFNGLGSKGALMAPYYAYRFAEQLLREEGEAQPTGFA